MKVGFKFRVGIVSLGSTGIGVALSYARAGLSIRGIDLNSNACATLRKADACEVSDNAATFAEKLGALLVLVVNATQVKQVLFGEAGVAQRLKPGMAVMVSSIIANVDVQEIATVLAGFDPEILDVPVPGGAVRAANGEMAIMAFGSDIVSERLAPMLEATAGKIYRVGAELGLGPTVKTIHQLLVGIHIVAGAEAVVLAARVGIPLDVMCDIVINAAGNPWMPENRICHMVDGDYTLHSAIDVLAKDLGLVVDTAKAPHFPLSLTSTALNMFTSTNNAGYGKEDDSAVIKVFSGTTLPGAKS